MILCKLISVPILFCKCLFLQILRWQFALQLHSSDRLSKFICIQFICFFFCLFVFKDGGDDFQVLYELEIRFDFLPSMIFWWIEVLFNEGWIIKFLFFWGITFSSCLRNLWLSKVQFSSVSRSIVSDSLRPHELQHASLSITSSRSLPNLMSIESMMPSNHLILCHPLLLLPPIPPSIRVFSNESALHMTVAQIMNSLLPNSDLNWRK